MARKKYYQSKKDRMDESRGMKRYEMRERRARRDESEGMKRYYRDKSMLGGEQRSYRDGRGTIYEDHNEIANLPQYVKYEEYPNPYYGRNDRYLGDSLRGIDLQIDDDVREMIRHEKPEKY